MSKQEYVVVNLSGGKDSSALTLRMIELGMHIDEVICADTFKEFPAMYRHLEKMRKVIEGAEIKFTVLRSDKSFDYLMFEHKVKRRNKDLDKFSGYSWAGNRSRWCTSKLKIDLIEKYLSSLSKQFKVIQMIGIAADEEYRLERENNQRTNQRHPLVEWGWTEEDTLHYCYDKGFDWEGLYEIFRKDNDKCPRVSCWCCPLQPLEDLRKLRKHFPELWEELKDMQSRTWRKIKPDYTVQQLDIRFALEEKYLAENKSITNKAFFAELRKELSKYEKV